MAPKKPNVVAPINKNSTKVMNQIQPSTLPKEVFKVPLGKEFTSALKINNLNVF